VPAFLLACLAYLGVALPGSTLGLLWPSIRLSLGQPVGALGILLVPGIAASVISSAARCPADIFEVSISCACSSAGGFVSSVFKLLICVPLGRKFVVPAPFAATDHTGQSGSDRVVPSFHGPAPEFPPDPQNGAALRETG